MLNGLQVPHSADMGEAEWRNMQSGNHLHIDDLCTNYFTFLYPKI